MWPSFLAVFFRVTHDGLSERGTTRSVSGEGKKFKLRTFAQSFSNIDFFLKILPLKDDELVMSEM